MPPEPPSPFKVDTVSYSIQTCWLLQFLLKPLILSKHILQLVISTWWPHKLLEILSGLSLSASNQLIQWQLQILSQLNSLGKNGLDESKSLKLLSVNFQASYYNILAVSFKLNENPVFLKKTRYSLVLTFKRQLLLTNKLPGLMSLCKIPAEWRYLSPE